MWKALSIGNLLSFMPGDLCILTSITLFINDLLSAVRLSFSHELRVTALLKLNRISRAEKGSAMRKGLRYYMQLLSDTDHEKEI
jgi:hypothetical protein